MLVLFSVIIIFMTIFLYWCYDIYKKNKMLEAIPGPLCIPFIGFKLPTDVYGVTTLFHDLFQKYGKTVKLYIGNQLHVVTCDVKLIEDLMKSNVHIEKSRVYDLAKPWLKEGLLTAPGGKWKSRRKLIAPSFNFGMIKIFFPIFKENTNTLVNKLEEQLDIGTSINVIDFFSKFSLDVVGESLLGVNLNMQKGKFKEYIKAAHRYTEIVLVRNFSFWKRFDLPFRLFAEEHEEAETVVGMLTSTTRKIIEQKREEFKSDDLLNKNESIETEDKKKVILLNALLQNPKLNDYDIEEEVNTFMFAGHDTTASGLSFTLYELSKKPDIQEKLYNEINSFIHNDFAHLTYENLQKMKYLDQVIKEVLRLRPTVPFIERKLCEDAKLGETVFPKGAVIIMHIYAVHHHDDYYNNPENFDPERFSLDNQNSPPTFAYVPFSAGPRNCIGQKYAVLEMKTALAKIIMCFKLHTVENFELVIGMAAVLRSKHGLPIKFEKRNKS